jgi:putative membrane protein insertion efficiency factor
MPGRIAVTLIVLYQRFLSPLKGPTCRFYPSCSSYARQAIERYGLLRGMLMSLGRVCRCHPFHPGGHDPVR